MQVELDKYDLKKLVTNSFPVNEDVEYLTNRKVGFITQTLGGQDVWHWCEDVIESLTDNELWELYNIIKESRA